jgi:glutamyl-tRNA synthetase
MRNYLVRLGWAHGDQEIFSTDEMIKAFDLAAIGRSPARFDFAKLENLNGHYIRQTPDADLVAEIERVLPYAPAGAELFAKLTMNPQKYRKGTAKRSHLTPEGQLGIGRAVVDYNVPRAEVVAEYDVDAKTIKRWAERYREQKNKGRLDENSPSGGAMPVWELKIKIRAAMPGLKERAKTLIELIESARYLYADRPLALDDKAKALITPEARTVLGNLSHELAMVDPWSAAGAEAALRAYAERAGVKLGAVAQPLRAALTGRTTSPGIFEVLAVLGKTESLARIGDQTAAHA